MTVTVSQNATDLDLAWVQGDPLSLTFKVAGVNWAGDYVTQVRRTPASDLLLTLSWSAIFDGTDTTFTTSKAAADNTVPAGDHVWDMQQTGGVTRLSGVVHVRAQVTR